jgi:hypothetical protein
MHMIGSITRPIARTLATTLRWPWQYAEIARRDLRLDFLRGFAILVIIVDHIIVARSWFYGISMNAEFIISAAELFFAISGVVIGVVASRQAELVAVKRSLRRAFELYLVAISIALFFLAVGWLTDLRMWDYAVRDVDASLDASVFMAIALQVLTLHAGFHGSEILIQYVVYMLLVPLAILACADRKDWLVIGGSLIVYAIGRLNPSAVTMPIASAFSLHQWQPLFFISFVIGYRREQLSRWLSHMRWPHVWAALIGLVALLFIYLYATNYQMFPGFHDRLGDRYDMRPARLLLVTVYLIASYLLITMAWRPLNALFGWLLIRLGQDALWCFGMHYVVILLLYNLPFFRSDASVEVGTLWHGVAVALVFVSLYVRDWALRLWPALRERYKAFVLATPAIVSFVAVQVILLLGGGAARTIIDDQDPGWSWSGWNFVADASAHGGSIRVASEAGSTALYTFHGTGLELYSRIGRSGGLVKILVDQRSYGEYDLYYSGPDTHHVRIFAVRDLTPGKHELRVIAKSNGETTIDYLKIAP